LSDIKNTFFNGDSEHFKTQLRKWVSDFGISSEDLKNLTIAALLGKLIASTSDGGLQKVLHAARDAARENGLANTLASAFVGEEPARSGKS
jgi:hypothetical protein